MCKLPPNKSVFIVSVWSGIVFRCLLWGLCCPHPMWMYVCMNCFAESVSWTKDGSQEATFSVGMSGLPSKTWRDNKLTWGLSAASWRAVHPSHELLSNKSEHECVGWLDNFSRHGEIKCLYCTSCFCAGIPFMLPWVISQINMKEYHSLAWDGRPAYRDMAGYNTSLCVLQGRLAIPREDIHALPN